MPCTLKKNVQGELGALSMLEYGKGLPIETADDLDVVDKLRKHYQKETKLPPKGDPRYE